MDARRERSRARDHDADAPSQASTDLGEDQAIPEARQQRTRTAGAEEAALAGEGDLEERALGAAGLSNQAPDPVVDPVEHPRCAHEQVRPQRRDVLEQPPHVALVEAYRTAFEEQKAQNGPLKDMCQRQVAQIHVVPENHPSQTHLHSSLCSRFSLTRLACGNAHVGGE